MYLIRADAARALIDVTLEGRLSSTELARATTQAAALARAGDLQGVLVDLRGVERGPGRWIQVAAILSLRCAPGMRIALVANEDQHLVARRIIRYSGIRNAFRGFLDVAAAEKWLATGSRAATRNLRPAAGDDGDEALATGVRTSAA